LQVKAVEKPWTVLAAQILTAIPGASAWFDRGFVTYSNAAKLNWQS
jgi:nicotinamide mononucleotide (NMN) deamidase PncC